ncbi:MAG: hypothetical protein VX829_07920 [Pseudomonadota bacterium]|nr:hypothetical protein [Pseudomonadota bacterium]
MSSLTVENTNQILKTVGIKMRVTDKGLHFVSQVAQFAKALAHCTSNPKARDDLITILAHYKEQPGLVFVINESQHQDLVDSAPSQNNLDQRPMNHFRPQYSDQQMDSEDKADNNHPTHNNTNDEQSQKQTAPVEFVGHHVYGSKAALYFAYDKTRDEDDTIAIDGAVSVAPRKYDWNKKLRIQITRSDLPNVAAVMFGLLKKVELSNYGADNTKRLMIENQGKNYFLNMSAKDYNQIAVPISASDIFEIRGLILAQLMKNRPEIGVEGVLANLKCHAAILKQAGQQ